MVSKKRIREGKITDKQLLDWNKQINQTYEMDSIRNHKNPIIRFQENNRIRKLIEMLDVKKKDIVGDIGCEDGYISSLLAPKCGSIYCIDIDSEMLKKARINIKTQNAEFIESNAENINIDDNTFNKTLCAAIMEHVPNPKRLINELVRITKPKGMILIMVPNERLVLIIKRTLRNLHLSFLLGGISKVMCKGHLHIFNKKK